MRKKLFGVLCSVILVFSACGQGAEDAQGHSAGEDLPADTLFTGIESLAVETVMENSAIVTELKDGGSEIEIDKIYFGAFSRADANEVLVLCKMTNLPHVAGEDRTAVLLFSADSSAMKLTAFKEIPADEVSLSCLPAASGQRRLLCSASTTYQGVTGQSIFLLRYRDGQWEDEAVEALKDVKGLDEDRLYYDGSAATMGNYKGQLGFPADDHIIIASLDKNRSFEKILGVLVWEPETEKFVLK